MRAAVALVLSWNWCLPRVSGTSWPNTYQNFANGGWEGVLGYSSTRKEHRDYREQRQLEALTLLLVHHGDRECKSTQSDNPFDLEETRLAIEAFQRRHNLAVDATHLGTDFWNALVVPIVPYDENTAVLALVWLLESAETPRRPFLWDDAPIQHDHLCNATFNDTVVEQVLRHPSAVTLNIKHPLHLAIGVRPEHWAELLREPEVRATAGCGRRAGFLHAFGVIWALTWLAFSFAFIRGRQPQQSEGARQSNTSSEIDALPILLSHSRSTRLREGGRWLRERWVPWLGLAGATVSHSLATVGMWMFPQDLVKELLVALYLSAAGLALVRLGADENSHRTTYKVMEMVAIFCLFFGMFLLVIVFPYNHGMWMNIIMIVGVLMWSLAIGSLSAQARFARGLLIWTMLLLTSVLPTGLTMAVRMVPEALLDFTLWLPALAPTGLMIVSLVAEDMVGHLIVKRCEYTAQTQWLLAIVFRYCLEVVRFNTALSVLLLSRISKASRWWWLVMHLAQTFGYETVRWGRPFVKKLCGCCRENSALGGSGCLSAIIGDGGSAPGPPFTNGEIVLRTGFHPCEYRARAAMFPIEAALLLAHVCQLAAMGFPVGMSSTDWMHGVALIGASSVVRECLIHALVYVSGDRMPTMPWGQLPVHLVSMMAGVGAATAIFAQVQNSWLLYAHHWAACFLGGPREDESADNSEEWERSFGLAAAVLFGLTAWLGAAIAFLHWARLRWAREWRFCCGWSRWSRSDRAETTSKSDTTDKGPFLSVLATKQDDPTLADGRPISQYAREELKAALPSQQVEFPGQRSGENKTDESRKSSDWDKALGVLEKEVPPHEPPPSRECEGLVLTEAEVKLEFNNNMDQLAQDLLAKLACPDALSPGGNNAVGLAPSQRPSQHGHAVVGLPRGQPSSQQGVALVGLPREQPPHDAEDSPIARAVSESLELDEIIRDMPEDSPAATLRLAAPALSGPASGSRSDGPPSKPAAGPSPNEPPATSRSAPRASSEVDRTGKLAAPAPNEPLEPQEASGSGWAELDDLLADADSDRVARSYEASEVNTEGPEIGKDFSEVDALIKEGTDPNLSKFFENREKDKDGGPSIDDGVKDKTGGPPVDYRDIHKDGRSEPEPEGEGEPEPESVEVVPLVCRNSQTESLANQLLGTGELPEDAFEQLMKACDNEIEEENMLAALSEEERAKYHSARAASKAAAEREVELQAAAKSAAEQEAAKRALQAEQEAAQRALQAEREREEAARKALEAAKEEARRAARAVAEDALTSAIRARDRALIEQRLKEARTHHIAEDRLAEASRVIRELEEEERQAAEAARIRAGQERLRAAFESESVEVLEEAIAEARAQELPEQDIAEAERHVAALVAKEKQAAASQNLANLLRGEDAAELEGAIEQAEALGVDKEQIAMAQARLQQILRLDAARRELEEALHMPSSPFRAPSKRMDMKKAPTVDQAHVRANIEKLEDALREARAAGVPASATADAEAKLVALRVERRRGEARRVLEEVLRAQDIEKIKAALQEARAAKVEDIVIMRAEEELKNLIEEVELANDKMSLLLRKLENAVQAKKQAEKAQTSAEVEAMLGDRGVISSLATVIDDAKKAKFVRKNDIHKAETVLSEVTTALKRTLAEKQLQEKKRAEERLAVATESARATKPLTQLVLAALREAISEGEHWNADTEKAEAMLAALRVECEQSARAAKEQMHAKVAAGDADGIKECIKKCKTLLLDEIVVKAMDELREVIGKIIENAKDKDKEERLAAVAQCQALVEILRSNGISQLRAIHNAIQDLKGALRVFCRVRPPSQKEKQRGDAVAVKVEDQFTVSVMDRAEKQNFTYDAIFGSESSQEEVYSECRTLVQSALDGYNVTIFSYGQTGAGKTWTLYGAGHNPGISPRTCEEVFTMINRDKERFEFEVKVSMIELYMNDLRDLLTNSREPPKLEFKSVRQADGSIGISLDGAVERPAVSSEDLAKAVMTGLSQRKTKATQMNATSSRSHLLLIIKLLITEKTSRRSRNGKITLVDLAGSERLAKSGVTGEGAKEAIEINKSLSALGDVMAAFTSKAKVIPYRNHKLTQLMQDSLGGSAKTLMFVNLSPSSSNSDETICALKYASRARCIENEVQRDKGPQKTVDRVRRASTVASTVQGMKHAESGDRRNHG